MMSSALPSACHQLTKPDGAGSQGNTVKIGIGTLGRTIDIRYHHRISTRLVKLHIGQYQRRVGGIRQCSSR